MTVFPVPKPPGTATVPPSATGKRKSKMRCPVRKGRLASRRARTGRGRRTAQRCKSVMVLPSVSSTTGCSRVCSPGKTCFTSPCRPGGTITRCWRPPDSGTVPSTSPSFTCAPGSTCGVKTKRRARSMVGALAPGRMKSPESAARAARGRPMPSMTVPSRPGPSSTVSGRPSRFTGSSTARPIVSSKTCRVARSPVTRSTSASSPTSPTRTSSLSTASRMPLASASAPTTRVNRASVRGGLIAASPGSRWPGGGSPARRLRPRRPRPMTAEGRG